MDKKLILEVENTCDIQFDIKIKTIQIIYNYENCFTYFDVNKNMTSRKIIFELTIYNEPFLEVKGEDRVGRFIPTHCTAG